MSKQCNKIYAPVIIPTCNRYSHFRACIESLQKNTGASETEIFIGLDYPPSIEYEEGYQKIADYLNAGINGFKKVNVFKRKYNLNPEGNTQDLFNQVVTMGYDRFICTEDDNVFSVDFLEYMNDYLELYKDNDRIFSVCGHTMPDTAVFLGEKKYNTFAWQEYDGWGTGLWVDMYKEYLDTISEEWLEKAIRKTGYIRALKMHRRKRYKMVHNLRTSNEKQLAQDMGLSFWQSMTNKYQICPCRTKVKNNGYDGLGVNCPDSKEKNEGVFNDCQENFSPKSVDYFLHKLKKKYYHKKYAEEAWSFRGEITYFLIHAFGLQKAEKILASLRW